MKPLRLMIAEFAGLGGGSCTGLAVLRATLFVGIMSAYGAQWSVPQRPWLYILDVDSLHHSGHILLLDPLKRTVRGSVETGADPDFALSKDGRYMYLTSGGAGEGLLSVIDTQSGLVTRSAAVPFRINYVLLPTHSTIAVSTDDTRVYVETLRTTESGDVYGIATFDVRSAAFRKVEASVPGCGLAQIMPLAGAWDMAVLCENTNSVRYLLLADDGSARRFKDVPLPWRNEPTTPGHRIDVTTAVWQDNEVFALLGDGTVVAARPTGQGDEMAITWPSQSRRLLARAWGRSADNKMLYIGSTQETAAANQGMATRLDIFDLRSALYHDSIPLDTPFWSSFVSADGLGVFVTSPNTQSVLSIDPATGLIGRISGVGISPVLGIPVQ